MTASDWFRVVEKEFKRQRTIVHVVAGAENNIKLMNKLRRLARKAGQPWRFQRETGGVIVRKA